MKKIVIVYIYLLITNTVFSQFNLDSGLVLYVNFNQDSIEDLSVLKSKSHIYGNSAIFDLGYDMTRALKIDGSSALQFELDTTIFSASVWVKTDIEVNNLDKWLSVLQFYEFGVESSVNTACLFLGPSSSYARNEEVVVNKSIRSQNYYSRTMAGDLELDNQWHHYLMNYNDTVARYDVYVDGVKTATFTGTSTGHTELLKSFNPVIGVRFYANGLIKTKNTGLIDEVRMYDRSLTNTEIDDLSKSYKKLVTSNEMNLEIGKAIIFPTIVDDNMSFRINKKIVSADFYSIEGRFIASVSDLNTFDPSLLSIGLNYVVIEFVNGEKQTQKIIKK